MDDIKSLMLYWAGATCFVAFFCYVGEAIGQTQSMKMQRAIDRVLIRLN